MNEEKMNLDMAFAKKISDQNADKNWNRLQERRRKEAEQKQFNRLCWTLMAVIVGLLVIAELLH